MAGIAEHEVFGLVGEDGFQRICQAFYRQVPNDDILGAMYPADDLVGAETRLREFMIYRFGGPQTYMEHRGHPRLRMRHAPFQINLAARERWMKLMDVALQEARIDANAELVLRQFFEHMTTFLINCPE